MCYCISIIGQHQNFLELISSTDLQLKDTFLSLYGYGLQVIYSISDREGWGIFIDAPDFIPLLHNILGNPIDCPDKIIFRNAPSVHQQNSWDDPSRHYHQFLIELVNYIIAQLSAEWNTIFHILWLNIGAQEDWITDLHIYTPEINLKERNSLDNSQQWLLNFFLA